MPNPKAVFSCSVALLAALACGSRYSDALETLDSGDARDAATTMRTLLPDIGDDPVLERALRRYLRDPDSGATEMLRKALALRSGPTDASPQADRLRDAAAAITSQPGYHDAGVRQSGNWLSRLFERFQTRREPERDVELPVIPAGLGSWLVYLVMGVLGLALVAFVAFAVSHFRWKRSLRRKASALLDEDEPLRSSDEWLEKADALAAEGRFREAVRCLYLACLLRADEHGVARFRRHETNWEHLARIESGGRLPEGVDFRVHTGRFDRIWYGHRLKGREEFDDFRAWYQELAGRLREAAP